MPETECVVVMRWEGETEPAFAQKLQCPIDFSWEDIAVRAVDLAMRGAADHFEVVCGFRQGADGLWSECGNGSREVAFDAGDRADKSVTAVIPGGESLRFSTLHASPASIIVAAEELSGVSDPQLEITDVSPPAAPGA